MKKKKKINWKYSQAILSELHKTVLNDSEINSRMNKISEPQTKTKSDFIHNWAKLHVKVKRGTTLK